ncbi:hypothetical protein OFC08_33795, partial [Escherichia coli]|nr:hypothetical protein [Escherichia coli]
VKRVIVGADGEAPEGVDPQAWATSDDALPYTGDGPLVDSHPEFDGTPNREALSAITAWLAGEGKGEATVNFRLRDWLVSRQ